MSKLNIYEYNKYSLTKLSVFIITNYGFVRDLFDNPSRIPSSAKSLLFSYKLLMPLSFIN